MLLEKLKEHKFIFVEILVLILVINLAGYLNKSNRLDIWEFDGSDTQFEVLAARQINNGGNPYKEILDKDLLNNDKYATLLPLYYQYLGLLDRVAQGNFEEIMDIHRDVLFIAQIVGAIAIYLIFKREDKPFVGIVAGTFWIFNRWTLANVMYAKQDIIAIAAMLVSLYFFTNKKTWGYYLAALFFGISLGIKHIGVFISPIFLLPIVYKKLKFREILVYAFLLLIPTFLIGLPIILDSVLGFFYSIMFSFTRAPNHTGDGKYVYHSLVLYEVGVKNNNIIYYVLPRLPLVIFTFSSTILMLLKKIPIFAYCLIGVFVFVALNPTLLEQYFTWIAPLVFLTMIENKVFIS